MILLQKWYSRIVSLNGTLVGRERREREIVILIAAFAAVVTATLTVGTFFRGGLHLGVVGGLILFAPSFGLILMSPFMEYTRAHLTLWILISFAGITCADVYFRAEDRQTTWPIYVVLIDIVLVLRLGQRFAACIVTTVVVWMMVIYSERTQRFGLFDIPLLESQANRREFISSTLDCDNLPCPTSGWTPLVSELMGISVFLADFIATRGFAQQVEKEQTSMANTIQMVQEIATLLSCYDVAAVTDILDQTETDLPHEMFHALKRIEQNLRVYKPYLPAALFEEMQENNSSFTRRHSVPPPGIHTEDATIVFTDIRASTAIWEMSPDAMAKSIRIHNALLRQTLDECGGYEVKTIGDAFMVAFDNTPAGINFSLLVQEKLLQADWPTALLDVPICKAQDDPEGRTIWGGLTVRIGVNSGPVAVEENTLTGRVDYFGHAVNIAARLESSCVPGAVAVPACLWETSVSSCLPALANQSELLHLKGVTYPVEVRSVWPSALSERKRHPLSDHHGSNLSSRSTRSDVSVSLSTSASVLSALQVTPTLRSSSATIGVIHINVEGQESGVAWGLGAGLESLTPALGQSGGTLISLLGRKVCVGWNLSRACREHAESALRMMERLTRSMGGAMAGGAVSSGVVMHGDVGTKTQRFWNVIGDPVDASWTLSDAAAAEGEVWYLPPAGMPDLPVSLRTELTQHPSREGIYQLISAVSQEYSSPSDSSEVTK